MKTTIFNTTLIILTFALTVLVIVGGSYFRAGLDVTVGELSQSRIRAPHVVENVLETERNRQAAYVRAHGLELVNTIDTEEWPLVDYNLLNLRAEIEEIRQAYNLERQAYNQAVEIWETRNAQIEAAEMLHAEWTARDLAATALGTFLPIQDTEPTIPEPLPQPIFAGITFEKFAALHMEFSESDQQMLVTLPDESFDMLWEAIVTVAEAVQANSLITEIDFFTERAVQTAIEGLHGLDRVAEVLVESIVLRHLRPNAIPDHERNRQNFEEARNNYERNFFQLNQIIVDEGEEITPEIYHMLQQLGLLRSDSIVENVIPMLGVLSLVALLFAISIMYLMFYRPKIKANKKEAILLFTVYVLSLSLVWMMRDLSFPYLPILMFAMFISLLIDRRCAIALNFTMVLICFFIVDGTIGFLLFYITAGATICMLSRFTTERNKIFLVGFVVTGIQFGLYIAVMLIVGRDLALNDWQGLLFGATFAAASGMLTVIICTGSLPFWETVFGVVTPVKLLDLTNPTNLLLRRLTIEAPGTYHHSLIVANLVETAAYDIGANAHAARVGGYYHDVGKLKFPHYFAENLDGENPHDLIEPQGSAKIILSHVSYGLALATEHRLPQFVRDMIKEHHGTTLLQFFFTKAREIDPDVHESEYRYPFVIPQTRESACVMLADSVEAAVRATMPKMKSLDQVEKTIRNIIRGKLNDGQLADSQLSIRDVMVIEQSFYRVLKGMYHERIVYPKADHSPPVRVVER